MGSWRDWADYQHPSCETSAAQGLFTLAFGERRELGLCWLDDALAGIPGRAAVRHDDAGRAVTRTFRAARPGARGPGPARVRARGSGGHAGVARARTRRRDRRR